MRHPKDLSRRQFLTRAGGAAIAMPSLAAILAACSKPSSSAPSGGAGEIPIATLENPVTLPVNQAPIAADTPAESGPLVLYNWADYIWKKSVAEFEDKFGVSVDLTTFNNMEEGIQKVANGQVTADVFVPTPGYLRRLVQQNLVQPLQHELIPNMEANVWPSYYNPGPYYDLGWNYTVPYTIYTWGVAYRRDRVSDDEAAAQGWEALWNNDYNGAISLYDSYGDTIAITILRNGSLDVNTGDPALIDAAKEAILQTINDNKARLTINGVYAKTPGRRLHGRRVLVGRYRRRTVVPAQGHRHRRARLLAARNGQDDDRQRPAGHPDGGEEPAPRARVHQLHARREGRVRELHQLERLSAALHVDRSHQADR